MPVVLVGLSKTVNPVNSANVNTHCANVAGQSAKSCQRMPVFAVESSGYMVASWVMPRLWDEPRCLITPHVARGNHLEETSEQIIRIALHNVSRYAKQQELLKDRKSVV